MDEAFRLSVSLAPFCGGTATGADRTKVATCIRQIRRRRHVPGDGVPDASDSRVIGSGRATGAGHSDPAVAHMRQFDAILR